MSLDPNCNKPPIPRAYIVCKEDQNAEDQIRYWTGFPDDLEEEEINISNFTTPTISLISNSTSSSRVAASEQVVANVAAYSNHQQQRIVTL
jgi:hypothetical protein